MSSTSTLPADAIAGFRDDLESARADLNAAIARIVGRLEPWGLFDEDEDGKRHVDPEALAELLDNVNQADDAVADAFSDYDWLLARAFRDFSRRLKALEDG